VPGFESIVGQIQPIRILTTLLRKGTIPHAFLFSGIKGVGKKTTAMSFAGACNCQDAIAFRLPEEGRLLADGKQQVLSPCGQCRSCKKIISGNHPDIIHIKPSGTYIRISQIRSVIDTLSLKPYEARFRVVLISDAQAMNPEAGNALLKVLEEPPTQTILILTTLQASDLLPTVVSRCQHIRFNPLSPKDIETMLAAEQEIDPNEVSVTAIMANGSYSKALALTKSDWRLRRKWLITASGLDQPQKIPSRSIRLLLAFAEKLALDKDALSDSLEILKTWLRDLIVFKYTPEKIINKDLSDKIQFASQKMAVALLLSQINVIQSAQNAIQANTNTKLTMETMMLRLANTMEPL